MIRILSASAVAAVLCLSWAATGVRADTCCGTSSVSFEPGATGAGATVAVDGLACKAADGGPGSPLALLGGFWLTTETRDAFLEGGLDPEPADWPAFASVADPAALEGSGTLVVPDLPDGRYTLWWACHDPADPAGSSYAIQYSTGPRLVVGNPPDTATAPGGGALVPDGTWLLVAAGLAGGLVAIRRRPASEATAGRQQASTRRGAGPRQAT